MAQKKKPTKKGNKGDKDAVEAKANTEETPSKTSVIQRPWN